MKQPHANHCRFLWMTSGILIALLGTTPALATPTINFDMSEYWETFSNQPYGEGAFPDANVWYERIRIGVHPEQPTALKFNIPPQGTGTYISLTVYSQRLGAMIDERSTIHSGRLQTNADGSYTIHALPASRLNGNTPPDNTFLLYDDGTQGVSYLEIWFRTYDIREQNRPALPHVMAVDPDDWTQPIERPKNIVAYRPSRLTQVDLLPPAPDHNGWVRFFRPPTTNGLYANPDTTYLSARMIQSRQLDLVTVIRFKKPDAKSWSFCMAGGLWQQTGSCLSHLNAVYDNGYITIVIAHSDPRNINEQRRYNYLPQTTFRLGTGAIYRNLLPEEDSPHSILKVPPLPRSSERPPEFDTDSFAADQTMGEFAPVGIQCRRRTTNGRANYAELPCNWRNSLQQLSDYQNQLP